ncbi:MAG TPA: dienelactone hydrolase family protein [Candidatus Acidoferrum sp.]|nr:dienelactone hydrolase family protein [Candidatus Acidoferrum sp.]
MKRFSQLVALVLALLAARAVSAQDWAKAALENSPRHREWVTIKHGNRPVETFVAYPESKDKTPVVIVIHEIFGMTDWVQDLADEIAAAGYIAVAPDLLSGMGPNGGRSSSFDQGKAMEAVSHLDPDQVTADLLAVADYGKKLPASTGKLFVVGFCWGGGQSFRFATNRADLAGAFVFYGGPPDKDAMARIHAPVYAFYAGNDARVDATIPDATAGMKAAGKYYEPVTYDGAGHGFMRAGEAPDANDANKKARADSWARLKDLLAKN